MSAIRELTPMQAANWFSRDTNDGLGGVAAHLYVEFDGTGIDLPRLNTALGQVCLLHPMLRLQVTPEGRQTIAPADRMPQMEVDDFTGMCAADLERALLEKREHWTHQKLDLSRGQASRFSISLLPNDAFRLHVDTDMVAIDPSSFQRLMEELALHYENKSASIAPLPLFFDWCDKIQTDVQLKALRERDRLWWRERLSKIAPAPSLPLHRAVPGGVRSHRLSSWLHPDEHQALRQLARTQHITFSSMLLGLFAITLGSATEDRRFRLNIPLFWRHPLVDDVEKIIGDFVSLVILDVDLAAADSVGTLCRNLASQMIERLEHCHYSGVNLMRDLSRHHGSAQLSPVVFSAAVDLPGGDLFSSSVQHVFGKMNWAISQGAHVALDAQVASHDGGLLVNWDIRLDALPQNWITTLFDRFIALLKEATTTPEIMARPVGAFAPMSNVGPRNEQPLTAMQRAYLLGRTTQLPLGGVAMQDFREYRGVMNPELLRNRLVNLVQRHASLRTFIDAEKLVAAIHDEALLNLREIDLTELSSQNALKQVEESRNLYRHSMLDLNRSPWDITVYRLENDLLVVFVRFDALILDGQSISALMVELFEGRSPIPQSFPEDLSKPEDAATLRQIDATYWKTKLSKMDVVAQLPWRKPLAQLTTSRYERQSAVINPEIFKQLCRAGAKQGLFKNTIIMALVLEVLIHWNSKTRLCVAVPVMPLQAKAFSSNSTFIAVEWGIKHDSFSDRAANLQADILEGMSHLSFSGVDLARLLFEQCGAGPVLPIVITNGLYWPNLSDSSPMKLYGGLTQTPQVAIDVRFTSGTDGSLVFDIDYACDAVAPAVIGDMLGEIENAVKQIAASECFSINTWKFPSKIDESRASASSDKIQLLRIYIDVLGKSPDFHLDSSMNLTDIGLLPKHLKMISTRLRTELSIEVTPAQLLSCRNIDDVERLLATCNSDKC